MKRTTKKSASKKTAKGKATKKVTRKKVVKRKRNPEIKWSKLESLMRDVQKDIDRIENKKEKERLQNAFNRYLDSIAIEGDTSKEALSRHYRILEGFREKIFAVQIKEETPRLIRDIEEGRWVPFK